MKHSAALAALIDALRALPGVGPKSAQRMAFHLLQEARPAAQALAGTLVLLNRSMSIAGGTSEIKRNQIAEQVLGLPREPLAVAPS